MGAGLFSITVVAFLRPPLLPDLGRDLDLSAVGLSALASTFAMGRMVADIPAGRSTDRFAPGPMMAFAALLVTIGTAGMAASQSAVLLFGSSFVLGLGSSWALATGIAFFAAAPKERRGASLSLFGGSLLTGQAAGPALAGAAALTLGWRGVLLGGAFVTTATGLSMFRLRRTELARSSPVQNQTPTLTSVPPRVFYVIYLLPAVQFAVGAAIIQTLIPLIADDALGYSSGVIGLALGLGGLARLLAAVVAGQVSDRVTRKAALIPGLVLQVAGLVAFAADGGVVGWWMTIGLLTLGSMSVNVGSTILADLTEGAAMGKRLGAFRFTGDAAFLAAPLITGALFESRGVFLSAMPLLGFSIFVLIASITIIPETNP